MQVRDFCIPTMFVQSPCSEICQCQLCVLFWFFTPFTGNRWIGQLRAQRPQTPTQIPSVLQLPPSAAVEENPCIGSASFAPSEVHAWKQAHACVIWFCRAELGFTFCCHCYIPMLCRLQRKLRPRERNCHRYTVPIHGKFIRGQTPYVFLLRSMSIGLRRIHLAQLPLSGRPLLCPTMSFPGSPFFCLVARGINGVQERAPGKTTKSRCTDAFRCNHWRWVIVRPQITTLHLSPNDAFAVRITQKTSDVPFPKLFQWLLVIVALQLLVPLLKFSLISWNAMGWFLAQ